MRKFVSILCAVVAVSSFAACSEKRHSRETCAQMLEKIASIYGEDASAVTDDQIETCTNNDNFSRLSPDCIEKAASHKDLVACGLASM